MRFIQKHTYIYAFYTNDINQLAMNEKKDSVNRIRDILLGNNLAEMENRFLRLDQQITFSLDEAQTKWLEQLNSLKEEHQNSVEQLSQQLTASISKMAEELKAELASQKSKLDDLKLFNTELQTSLNALETSQAKQKQSLKAHFEMETASLKKLIFDKFSDLQLNKIDRSSLAVLLSELAVNLSDSESKTEETGIS
ncbi:MAG: hypothetical protein RBR87_15360 [Bacteroidales bacterium]|jgi:hypothetical protein|nr:hypothetical protein [Bacteroidales bacterium]